jgi:transcription elongation factor/antiterminator RfaH
MTTGGAKWYALYVRSRYEKRAHRDLREKGVEVFLPLIEEVHSWSDRKKKVQEPLFRGYLFVKTDLHERTKILETTGVVHFVGIKGKASAIPDPQIDWLRRITGETITVRREPYVEVGERVRVIAGSLNGVEGIVMRTKGLSRIVISVATIAQSVSVQVPTEYLEKA